MSNSARRSVIIFVSSYTSINSCSGHGPKVTPDTCDAFKAFGSFHASAKAAITPSGYVSTFVDASAIVSSNSYLALFTLNSYDVGLCAKYCDKEKLCTSFNVYIERSPSVKPGNKCSNPPSITNYRCTLWGSGIEAG